MLSSTNAKTTAHWSRLAALLCLALIANGARAETVEERLRKDSRPAAPELDGAAAWFNVEKPIKIADLKGKVVLFDFWTFGCINCMHIMPDLKKLEKKYSKELVVIGVHSAKFANEKGSENIKKAVQRYGLEHPIANDDQMKIWESYQVDTWPTLWLVDPNGKLITYFTGEGNLDDIDRWIAAAIKFFDEKKLIDRNKVIGKPDVLTGTVLKFPGKIISQMEPKRLFIADTDNNRILISSPEGTVSTVIGSGKEGSTDGDFASASFHMPQGLAVNGDTLYVADYGNHLIRKVDLKAKTVETIAGTGKQGYNKGGPAKTTDLNSPWDVAVSPDNKLLYIAMAGNHTVWVMELASGTLRILSGNGKEFIGDGPFDSASHAQPSGLALKGDMLYVADAEGSAIRAIDLKNKRTSTVVGYPGIQQCLFTFGDRDGKSGTALLQHALGVVSIADKLYITDTYNHKIKVIDPATQTATTFLGDGRAGKDDGKNARFFEPAGLAYLEGKLFIADTNNHVIRVADLKTKDVTTLQIKLPK